MSDDLLLVRLLALLREDRDLELLRQGAGMVAVPVEVIEADSIARARAMVAARDIEMAMLDGADTAADRAAFVADAKAARQPPQVIFLAPGRVEAIKQAAGGVEARADAIVVRPANANQARALIERCIRLRQACRVLLVDDSTIIRAIVRKVLMSSRFRLDITEAAEGAEALNHIRTGMFDMVLLDQNMPGLNGLETLAEIKRQNLSVEAVIMTSMGDEALAKRARNAGAAAVLKKPFYPADVDAVLHDVLGLWGEN